MGGLAFLFAGQGAEAPGMGLSLFSMGGEAAEVFHTMEKVRPGTMTDCFEGGPERLAEAGVGQPCVYTVAMAAAEALRAAGVVPDAVAGFSVGELAALTFAGAFPSIESGCELVCCRGQLMRKAAEAAPGAMVAVAGLSDEAVEGLCFSSRELWPVSYDCPGRVVVAGPEGAVPAFCAAVTAAGGQAQPLPADGAFHSPLMRKAAEAFAPKLARGMERPEIPVYANLDAAPYEDDLEATLAMQLRGPVRFSETITRMAKDGITTFVEVGHGELLGGFVRRILPEAAVFSVQDAESLAATLEALAEAGPRVAARATEATRADGGPQD